MKIYELLNLQPLDEISLKQAVVAGMLGTASLAPSYSATPTHDTIQQPARLTRVQLADKIAARYKINPDLASHIVQLAHKYAHPSFLTAKDILAIVGVESSFNPKAKSHLKRDPAIGLMQVRPRVWNLNRRKLASDIESQIAHGSRVLCHYYEKLGDKADAIQAYNVGITAFLNGIENPQYLSKVEAELNLYKI